VKSRGTVGGAVELCEAKSSVLLMNRDGPCNELSSSKIAKLRLQDAETSSTKQRPISAGRGAKDLSLHPDPVCVARASRCCAVERLRGRGALTRQAVKSRPSWSGLQKDNQQSVGGQHRQWFKQKTSGNNRVDCNTIISSSFRFTEARAFANLALASEYSMLDSSSA
jgi:hypothetical protein